MKVTLKGVNTSNLAVPLEDIEGAIPVLAEMVNDSNKDISYLDISVATIVGMINNLENELRNELRNTSNELNTSSVELIRRIGIVMGTVNDLRENIFIIQETLNNTRENRLRRFLKRLFSLRRK